MSSVALVTGTHRSGSSWVGQTISQIAHASYVWEPFNINSPAFYRGYLSPSLVNLDRWFQAVPHCHPVWKELNITFDSKVGNYRSLFSHLASAGSAKRLAHYIIRVCHLQRDLLFSNRFLIKDPIMLFSTESSLESGLIQKALVLTRDPRAFYGSLKKAEWPFNFSHISDSVSSLEHLKHYQQTVDINISLGPSLHPSTISDLWLILHEHILHLSKRCSILTLRYEDICANPVEMFAEATNFLFGLRLDQTSLERYFISVGHNNFEPDRHGIQMVRRGNSHAISQLWKHRVNEDENAIIVSKCRHLMDRLGYDN